MTTAQQDQIDQLIFDLSQAEGQITSLKNSVAALKQRNTDLERLVSQMTSVFQDLTTRIDRSLGR